MILVERILRRVSPGVTATLSRRSCLTQLIMHKEEYKGQFALAGDPRASAQAQMSVYAAAIYNGGSLDAVQPGLDFFKKVNDAGNFVPVIAKQATVAKGETPIILRWDYSALADKDTLAGNPNIAVVYP